MASVPSKAAGDIIRWLEHPAVMVRELFGVEPDPWQAEVLEVFPTPAGKRIAMPASKGPGKTAVEAWLIWNFLLTRPYPKVAATSVTADNLRDNLWAELAKWQEKSALLKSAFQWGKERIFARDHPETWWATARTWSQSADALTQSETLAGLHADYTLFVLDESGGIPDAVMAAAEGALATGKECHILQGGNTSRREGPLFRACTSERKLWYVVRINGDPDDPKRSPRVDPQWARDQIAKYGRDNPWVLVNVFGEFPPSSLNTLIGPDEMMAAEKRSYRDHDIAYSPRVLGVDVAREGDDASVMFPRQGLVLFSANMWRNIDGIQGAGHVARKWQDWDADACFVDNTGGYGASWIDNLRLLGMSPIAVQYSGEPNDRRYYNKRAEMYFTFAEWIKQGGQLPPCPELVQAMTQVTYTFKGDRFLLEDKRQLKERIGISPDHADAACFLPHTMIRTPKGERPIEELAIGDEVLSPFGTVRVVKTWSSRTEWLTTARFSHGRELSGTPWHKIFVWGAGILRLDAISSTIEVEPYGRWRRVLWKFRRLLSTEARSLGFKRAVDIISRRAGRLERRDFSIVGSGRSSVALYRRVCTSITSMATGPMARSATLSYLHPLSTTCSTQQSCESAPATDPMLLRWPRRLNGIGAPTGKLGIVSMPEDQKLSGRERGASAWSAVRNLWDSPAPQTIGFAHRHVEREQNIANISRTGGTVADVVRNLWRIVSAQRSTVPISVRTERVPPTLVYNLSLDRDNAYYANDILVFNSQTFAAQIGPRRSERFERGSSRRSRYKSDYHPYAIDESEILR